jgi:hypothetical protein
MSNDAYANSGVKMRMRVVRAAKVLDSSAVESTFTSTTIIICQYVYLTLFFYMTNTY